MSTPIANTILNLKQNSDHYPICLNIPPNNILSKKPINAPNNKTKILNPIPPENINIFRIKFAKTNSNQIQQLINLLLYDTTLSQNQWQQVCEQMDQIVQNISKIIEDTYTAPPIPILTSLTNKQGGYLQGCQNGSPTVKFTVQTSARVRVYPADGFYRLHW
jgi:hypothetical protein